MSNKPIFVATHPRACSTAFERVFMTRRDTLKCIHEPFGDAFYFGPERLSERYENDPQARLESGFADSTFKSIFDRIEREGKEGKRVFIKDITHYLVPPNGQTAQIAPSLGGTRKGVGTDSPASNPKPVLSWLEWVFQAFTHGPKPEESDEHIIDAEKPSTTTPTKAPFPYGTQTEPGNPTVVPEAILKQFHFTFLIRHPRSSIPSYYRCTIPPLDKITGFYNFMPSEAGYDELRRVFDYLKSTRQIGPSVAGKYSGSLPNNEVSITVVDADDLLDNPSGIIKAYCKEVGVEYDPDMLNWQSEEDHDFAREAFEKWKGFHEDAIDSESLKARTHKKKVKTEEQEDKEWEEKFGAEGAKIIRETVNANIPDFEYLKSFAVKAAPDA